MKISELKDKHPSIYKKIVKYHEIQKLTGEPNLELEMVADALNWAKTSEGVDFWHNISLGVTDGFYEMYPEVNQQPISVTVFDPELDNQVDSLLDGVHAVEPNQFQVITNALADLLAYKNMKYGNSALNPLNVFTGKSKVGQRLDDKLSRIQNSDELRKNDVADVIGYLILVCKENNWTTFDEFKD